MFWSKKEKELTFDQKEQIAIEQIEGWQEFLQEQIDAAEDGVVPDLEMKVKEAEFILRALSTSVEFIRSFP